MVAQGHKRTIPALPPLSYVNGDGGKIPCVSDFGGVSGIGAGCSVIVPGAEGSATVDTVVPSARAVSTS